MFGGYLYINVSVARVYGERTPGASAQLIDDVFFGDHPDVPAYEPHPDDASEAARERMVKTLDWVLGAESLPELLDDRAEVDALVAARPPLGELSDVELVAHARSIVPLVRRLFDRHFLVSASAAFGPGVAGAVLAELDAADALLPLLAGIGDVDSAAPSHALWELSRSVRRSPALMAAFDAGVDEALGRIDRLDAPDARAFREALAAFLRDFGSRGPNEWDIYAHTWARGPRSPWWPSTGCATRTTPAGPTPAPSAGPASRPTSGRRRPRGPRPSSWRSCGPGSARARCSSRAGSAPRPTSSRRSTRSGWRSGRWAAVGWSVACSTSPASCACCSTASSTTPSTTSLPSARPSAVAERERDDLLLLRPPWVVNGVAPPLSSWTRRDAAACRSRASLATSSTGGAASPGSATGRARIVTDPAAARLLEPGEILVAPVTDPSWTPLFLTAAAVVVDVGAMGSHAMIVSRELGIPCVASVTDATRRIPDGAIVTVDGTRGTVRIDALPDGGA